MDLQTPASATARTKSVETLYAAFGFRCRLSAQSFRGFRRREWLTLKCLHSCGWQIVMATAGTNRYISNLRATSTTSRGRAVGSRFAPGRCRLLSRSSSGSLGPLSAKSVWGCFLGGCSPSAAAIQAHYRSCSLSVHGAAFHRGRASASTEHRSNLFFGLTETDCDAHVPLVLVLAPTEMALQGGKRSQEALERRTAAKKAKLKAKKGR